MNTGSIVAPPNPLELWGAGRVPALIASITNSAPFLPGTPKGPAAGPVKKVTTPTLIESFAEAVPAIIAPTAQQAASALTRMTSRVKSFFITGIPPVIKYVDL